MDKPVAIFVRGLRDPIFITQVEARIPYLVAQGWKVLIKDSDMTTPPLASPQADGDHSEDGA